ncbi:phage holin family protein [Frankia sp. Cr2]|uniref:phage holin family protein n=1 Tax=Frankia sp. Cr2 TaxID=3073932 RepID=UPI002AD3C407|nr:phage holin family protein [Frankia sp. Cr2]
MSTPTQNRPAAREATLGELVALAARDLSLLVRQEVDLAKAELSKQATSAALGVGFLVVAAGLGFGALIAVTIGLGELFTWAGVERFWAYFLTALLYLVVAGVLGLFGATRLKKISPPERTLQTVKEDIAWLKHPTALADTGANHSNGHMSGNSRSSVPIH